MPRLSLIRIVVWMMEVQEIHSARAALTAIVGTKIKRISRSEIFVPTILCPCQSICTRGARTLVRLHQQTMRTTLDAVFRMMEMPETRGARAALTIEMAGTKTKRRSKPWTFLPTILCPCQNICTRHAESLVPQQADITMISDLDSASCKPT